MVIFEMGFFVLYMYWWADPVGHSNIVDLAYLLFPRTVEVNIVHLPYI